MKILHTSDWHLGQLFYNYDRREEHLKMLKQIEDIVVEEQPDLFIMAGDLFHTSQPSASVQRMCQQALLSIHKACPDMTMVIIAGNHDSASRHEIWRELWELQNVYFIGTLNADDIDSHIVKIQNKGYVLALPYWPERYTPDDIVKRGIECIEKSNENKLPIVVTAHTVVKGSNLTGHSSVNEYSVGGIDYVDPDYFGEGYDYVALGHIHHSQWVDKSRHIRYCGTPLPISFDEDFSHSVSMVDIPGRGAPITLKKIELNSFKELITIPDNDAHDWENVENYLKSFDSEKEAFIRIKLKSYNLIPADALARATRLTKDKKCQICCVTLVRDDSKKNDNANVITTQELKEISPILIAKQQAEFNNKYFDEEMEQMLLQILSEVAEEERQ